MKKVLIYIIACIALLFGCSCKENVTNEYNVKILKNTDYTFNKDFLANNKTCGAIDVINEYTYYIYDDSFPKELIIKIRSEEELNKAFDDFIDVDFNSEMVVLYGFTTAAHPEKLGEKYYIITEARLVDDSLKITCEIRKKYKNSRDLYVPDASIPDTKWIVFKMNIVEFSKIEFVG